MTVLHSLAIEQALLMFELWVTRLDGFTHDNQVTFALLGTP